MNLQIFNYFFSLGQLYPILGNSAVFISGPLSYIIVPALVTLYFFVVSKHKMSLFALVYLSLFSAWFIARLLKEIIQINRPFITHSLVPLSQVGGYSFPSEHAAVYGALSVILLFLDKPLGYIMIGFTVLVMLSRMVVGVHYPLDVIVGVLVGVLCGLFFIRLISKLL